MGTGRPLQLQRHTPFYILFCLCMNISQGRVREKNLLRKIRWERKMDCQCKIESVQHRKGYAECMAEVKSYCVSGWIVYLQFYCVSVLHIGIWFWSGMWKRICMSHHTHIIERKVILCSLCAEYPHPRPYTMFWTFFLYHHAAVCLENRHALWSSYVYGGRNAIFTSHEN